MHRFAEVLTTKKLHKNDMTKPHKFEVNSTFPGSLKHFQFFLGQEMIKVERVFFTGDFKNSIQYQLL
jgi:hypothetical protein